MSVSKFMIIRKKDIKTEGENILVSFDLEWTKNYKIKNGNKPFCFSFVYFHLDCMPKKLENLDFGFCSFYIESRKEEKSLVASADIELRKYINQKITIVGHQLSSDISVLLNYGNTRQTTNFSKLKEYWHNRKNSQNHLEVFDTRYDLDPLLKGKSRRLVDVCTELNLDVKQPELKGSMTKMQNIYLDNNDISFMEKLSILNIRHGLSAAILYYYFKKMEKKFDPINVNEIIHKNCSNHYDYVNSKEFSALVVK